MPMHTRNTFKYLAGMTFLGIAFFVLPVDASAQTDTASLQTSLDFIKGQLSMPSQQFVLTSADVQGPPCSNDSSEDACSMVAKEGGHFDKGGITYAAGDIVKCYNSTIRFELTSCAASNSRGTTFTLSRYGTASITTDTQGKILGSTDTGIIAAAIQSTAQSAVDAATDAAGSKLAGVVSDVGTQVVKVVGTAILALANFLLGIAGTLLNWVVVKTVFQFGSLIGNSPGVLVAWGIFRDIGNLVLLFGFIFMGLAMILNLNTFSAQKAIPRLLIFAILMNFSLFAAEALIDVTNAVSSVMYAQANTDPCNNGPATAGPVQAQGSGSEAGDAGDAGGAGSLADCSINYGIAGHIMQSTGLATIWKTTGTFSATTVTYIGLALFATIGAVVLFATAIMLAIRLIVLSFLMVTSPVGFAGMAIPPLQKFAKMWWSKLISQAIFAPVLFLLIFVSLKITDSFTVNSADRSLAGALTQPNASVMGIIMVFVIVIGFLVASLMAARGIGAQGANGAINIAGKFVGKAGLGTTAFLGRQTVGRGSAGVARQIRGSRFGETQLGRRFAGIADRGAKASFDARGTKVLKSITKSAKIDLGEAQKGGIAKNIEQARKARIDYAKSLKGRVETDDEYTTRLSLLSSASTKAAEDTDTQLTTTNNASSKVQDVTATKSKEEQKLEQLRTQADRNPLDADLKKKVRDQEKVTADLTKQEADAERILIEETKKLAEARKAESDARDSEDRAKQNGPGEVNAKRQQGNYADNLDQSRFTGNENPSTPWRRTGQLRPLFGVTGRANEEAAKAIRAEMKKTKEEKLLEGIKEKLDSGDIKDAVDKLVEVGNKDEGKDSGEDKK